ncbi:ADP-ribose pyrophosphatase [Companilactobacillus sp. RD055328]|uniref:NUDIX hydrolase n=1 Tax=Companilactobacillus sp. RD055328 TaxID=2916634 RepID=UPI001FC7C2DE|nr:NUDIX hydrolase [Companilactobacillus sp. RD055328]GKQ42839.1 ADP-ribose pyrophosphatase [Companilactobacillus sp. RD055328]
MSKQSKFEEKVISEKNIFKGNVVDLSVQDVKLPDGSTSTREVIKHNGGVGIILIQDDKIALVRQWRAPMAKETLEIPAGKIDIGETDFKKVAKRELREETGFQADDLVLVDKFYCSVGYSNEMFYTFFAVNPKREFDDLKLDSDEFLNVEWFTLEEINKQIEQEFICDAKTLLAINYWQMNRGSQYG